MNILKRATVIFFCIIGYSLEVMAADIPVGCDSEPTNQAIMYGDSVSCSFTLGDDDFYTFNGSVDELAYIRVTRVSGVGGTPCIELLDPSNQRVALQCGISPYSFSAIIDTHLNATGIHTVRAFSSNPSFDAYNYMLVLDRTSPVSPTNVASGYGEILADGLEMGGDVDFFTFDARANDLSYICVTRSNSVGGTPLVEVYDSTGTLLTSGVGVVPYSFSTELEPRIPSTDTYTVRVQSTNPGTVYTYQVVMDRTVPVSDQAIPSFYGHITPGSFSALCEVNYFVFDGASGDDVAISVNRTSGVGGDPRIELFDSTGIRVAFADATSNSRVVLNHTLSQNDTFIIRLSAINPGSRFDYCFAFNTEAGPSCASTISCGNGIVEGVEQCDDGNTVGADGCSASCSIEICGNAILDPGEQCDDGNIFGGDGCSANCTVEECGNNILDPSEQCDDGNNISGDGCQANCILPICGDGVVDIGEQCDDNNNLNGDGCQANCSLPFCGDGILDVNEQCDDGNTISGDGCQANCSIPSCGDSILDPNEQCDDGNIISGDGCSGICTSEICGNAIIDPSEQCDDGNLINGDGCQADCSLPSCGDGILDSGEQCDDGNNIDGDGCQANCSLPFCGDGIVQVGEACDDANNNNFDGCRNDCALPICGDNIVDMGEACDDGNNVNGDGCQSNCTLPFCGDGILDAGEQCDDGNVLSGDGCSESCTVESSNGYAGCTPGYWKQPHHLDSWSGSYGPTTLFSEVFEDAYPGMTLLEVLGQGGGGLSALGRHTVAALRNAAAADVNYNLSTTEVVTMFNTVFPGSKRDYSGLKDIFENFNEQGCPLN